MDPAVLRQYCAAITGTAHGRQLRLLFGFGDGAEEYSLPRGHCSDQPRSCGSGRCRLG
jgi:hypothetical protein